MNKDTLALNLKNTVVSLRTKRLELDKTVFKTANDALYDLLGDVYEMGVTYGGNPTVRSSLLSLAQNDYSLRFKEKTPSLFNVLLKLVFADNNIPLRRLSSYKRVLDTVYSFNTYATKQQFIEVINEFGGLEEVRKNIDDGLSSEERAKKRFYDAMALALPLTIENNLLTQTMGNLNGEMGEGDVAVMIAVRNNGVMTWLPSFLTDEDEEAGSNVKTLFVKATKKIDSEAKKELEKRAELQKIKAHTPTETAA